MSRRKRTGTKPDVEALLEPLKGFQRKTVEHVFDRMYRDANPSTRFLVADEVGLGKTLVARGVIAKAIDHLWEKTGRIDIVYICSNVAIAQQNLQKIAVGDAASHALATRLTLLPQQLSGLDKHKVNFVSFTPGTSFDLKSRAGMVSERVVLHGLLTGVMDNSAGLRNLLQGNVGKGRWAYELRTADAELDATLVRAFRKVYRQRAQKQLRKQVKQAVALFGYYRKQWPHEHRVTRNRVVGALRMLLARTCVEKLEPDLIVLDEFQRFRHLLHEQDEMANLARSMWTYDTPEGERARVLLLSATPYRMYSTDFDNSEDDHYRDFLDTTRFLMNEDERRVEAFEGNLRGYRKAIHAALRGDDALSGAARTKVQKALRTVMVRTERVAETANRQAMLEEPKIGATLEASDLKQWMFVDELSRTLGDRDPMELWKSAPYLPQFMRTYKLKRSLEARLEDADVVDVIRRHKKATLRKGKVRAFEPLDPANARLRSVMSDLMGNEQWRLLWVPPTLPYWPMGEAFEKNARFTKALIFSAWHVVPDVVSVAMSYEADRQMLAGTLEGDATYFTLHKKHRGLLRFSMSKERLTGMTALALQYPSLTLADEASPLKLWREGTQDRRAAVRAKVVELLAGLPDGEGKPDERWFWAAPALLDGERGVGGEFLESWSLEASAAGEESLETEGAGGDDTRFAEHVGLLRKVLAGEERLGRKPDELAEVVTELALGAPGILAARSLAATGCSAPVDPAVRQRGAAMVAEGFRTSIGQEGLDFHPWSHAIVQWNLPGNPADLEQREGRVHRYEGHAVRRNVAAPNLPRDAFGKGTVLQPRRTFPRRCKPGGPRGYALQLLIKAPTQLPTGATSTPEAL